MSLPPQDRRFEPRAPVNTRAIIVAPGLEMACLIVDRSANGMRLRLDRSIALPKQIVVVVAATGIAAEAEVMWSKAQEAGVKVRAQTSLRGLVPARLAAARAAVVRAGGR